MVSISNMTKIVHTFTASITYFKIKQFGMFGYRMNMAYKAWIAHTLYLSSIHPLTHNNNSIIDNSIVITSQS